jgi:diaminopimelate epimerase
VKNGLFVKMTGAGNDFIIFDKKVNFDLSLNVELIKELCDRHFGIGADGVITIDDSGTHDFIMEYFNADGSTGSLCGNGARCAIKFAKESGRVKGTFTRFISNGVEYTGEILKDSKYCLNLNPPVKIIPELELIVDGNEINASFINSGSPHVVIGFEELSKIYGYKSLDEIPVMKFGREIRYSKEFEPEGTNVNFIKKEEDKIRIRSYERGVENETLACGTGAAAAGMVGFLRYNVNSPVSLITRSGDVLTVDFKYDSSSFYDVSLTGTAVTVFSGELVLPA